MDKDNSKFIRTRSTFRGATKSGMEKVTLYLGAKDVEQLLARIQESSGVDGVSLTAFFGEYNGKPSTSILVDSATRKQAPGGYQKPAGAPAAAKPKFTFKAKTVG